MKNQDLQFPYPFFHAHFIFYSRAVIVGIFLDPARTNNICNYKSNNIYIFYITCPLRLYGVRRCLPVRSRTERFSSHSHFCLFFLEPFNNRFCCLQLFPCFLGRLFFGNVFHNNLPVFFSFVSVLQQQCNLIININDTFNLHYLCATRCKDSSDALACTFASLACLFNMRIDSFFF